MIQEILSSPASLCIAPAGYGKTYTIIQCLKEHSGVKPILILTHTHAGVASIKNKIKEHKVVSSKYNVETICGYAASIMNTFHMDKNEIPPQEDSKTYFAFAIRVATKVINSQPVARVIQSKYSHLIVDEYQDCTVSQHNMILAMNSLLSTHLLGDPMQGIYGFGEELVDFNTHLGVFENQFSLETPWRWKKEGNSTALGDDLARIRAELSKEDKKVNFSQYKSILFCKGLEQDKFDKETLYGKYLRRIIYNTKKNERLNNLLIIIPEYNGEGVQYGNIFQRANVKSRLDFNNQLLLLEAIDDKKYYSIAKAIDDLMRLHIRNDQLRVQKLFVILQSLFNKGCVGKWFKSTGTGVIRKTGENKEIGEKLSVYVQNLFINKDMKQMVDLFTFCKKELSFKSKRPSLYYSLLHALQKAVFEGTTVYDSMVNYKNTIRRVGRTIEGKCIGTTLLTKGLEFDTVVILDAHKFKDYRHFYVAITRACKYLIVFSEKDEIELN